MFCGNLGFWLDFFPSGDNNNNNISKNYNICSYISPCVRYWKCLCLRVCMCVLLCFNESTRVWFSSLLVPLVLLQFNAWQSRVFRHFYSKAVVLLLLLLLRLLTFAVTKHKNCNVTTLTHTLPYNSHIHTLSKTNNRNAQPSPVVFWLMFHKILIVKKNMS